MSTALIQIRSQTATPTAQVHPQRKRARMLSAVSANSYTREHLPSAAVVSVLCAGADECQGGAVLQDQYLHRCCSTRHADTASGCTYASAAAAALAEKSRSAISSVTVTLTTDAQSGSMQMMCEAHNCQQDITGSRIMGRRLASRAVNRACSFLIAALRHLFGRTQSIRSLHKAYGLEAQSCLHGHQDIFIRLLEQRRLHSLHFGHDHELGHGQPSGRLQDEGFAQNAQQALTFLRLLTALSALRSLCVMPTTHVPHARHASRAQSSGSAFCKKRVFRTIHGLHAFRGRHGNFIVRQALPVSSALAEACFRLSVLLGFTPLPARLFAASSDCAQPLRGFS